MAKVSLICTVLNEEKTIKKLLRSIVTQSLQPNEVIFVDGGSTDATVRTIQIFAKQYPNLSVTVSVKKGNRSVGRNYAIKLAKYTLIAITDAGCSLSKNWLKELITQYNSSKAPVVAGYYAADAKTNFQKAVVPYILVTPDRVNPNTFLPATRSLLIEKKVFKNVGGFNEQLGDNEDYAFAKKIKKQKFSIVFAQKAIVFWIPRKTLREFYTMIFRFARGDIFAGIVRPKVLLIFLRYLVFALLLLIHAKILIAFLAFYCAWAIQKNKRYVGEGYVYLPLLQIVSDIAVIQGSLAGLFAKFFLPH